MNIFYLLFHPRKALRAFARESELQTQLAEAEAAQAQLQQRVEEAERLVAEAERKVEAYRQRMEQAEKHEEAIIAAKEDLRQQLEAERAETEEAMREITERLDKVDRLRDAYERRIAHLRHALAEAHTRLQFMESIDPDTLGAPPTVIDLKPEENDPSQRNVETPRHRSGKPERKGADAPDAQPTDWLMDLP